MSAFTDPSSIVLIVGAICIFIFIIHGLWFSGKPKNRKLQKDNARDQEISKSSHVGKVRIVTSELSDHDDLEDNIEISVGKINKSTPSSNSYTNNTRHMSLPEGFDDSYEQLQNSAAVSVNHKPRNTNDAAMGVEEVAYDGSQYNNSEPVQNVDPRNVYELIVSAAPGHPYLGEDIEDICNQKGFIQGFIKDNLKIYFVYENSNTKENEVFRICSMEAPYYFPENMKDFQTSAIALYMTLPEKGKAYAYFKALRMATEIFIDQLGGQIQDQHRNPLSSEQLDMIAAELQHYDGGLNTIH